MKKIAQFIIITLTIVLFVSAVGVASAQNISKGNGNGIGNEYVYSSLNEEAIEAIEKYIIIKNNKYQLKLNNESMKLFSPELREIIRDHLKLRNEGIEANVIEDLHTNKEIGGALELSSFEESEGELSILSSPGTRNASIITKKPLIGLFYATARSEAQYQQNTIGAKARAFKGDGTLLDTDTDSQSNSTFSSATAYPGSVGLYGFAIGNHTFKRDGYVDWYPETRKSF